jgi:hypothetical protein
VIGATPAAFATSLRYFHLRSIQRKIAYRTGLCQHILTYIDTGWHRTRVPVARTTERPGCSCSRLMVQSRVRAVGVRLEQPTLTVYGLAAEVPCTRASKGATAAMGHYLRLTS